ncbi:cell division protein FtsH [Plasmodium yoelii]|nr:cell division protein FtsH [Plasmodium yoelii]CDU20910.1 ATP-dependent zinc metalloprotease FTSH 1, putative [Plasmodium yoelii]VTZ81876.1 ATP-dependent zinc metalloprotease FTSH 1, putative [Plasmodium yoelii]|eukprot:XP_725471.2 cell division protein FtsH [Plasmodium yoelii]
MYNYYKNFTSKIMNSNQYANDNYASSESDKHGEEDESALLSNGDRKYMNKSKSNQYDIDNGYYGYYDKIFGKRRNKKWNYFVIFFLGVCLGFAIWPFFMTIITYKLVYKDNYNNHNFPTSDNSNSLKPYVNDKNRKNDNPNNRTPPSEQGQKKPSPHFKPVKFDEIAGIDESKLELLEVVDFIKNRERYQEMGARMPKGVLLVGPPGSGKTMLARAVATEANVPYIYTSGPEFIEIYVGQGAKRIRQLFSHARSVAPSIVFIDEIDAIGGKRSPSASNGAGQKEHDQTLNQLLVEMDGFSNTVHIMVIGATNRIDTLDSALLRPGRFDRIVYVPLPDVSGRKKILEIYIKKIKSNLNANDIERMSRLTPGFSGADLENLVNEATILATRNKKSLVTINELFEARDKVSMGPERKSLKQSEHQRRITAYHEAGHAIVAYFLHPKTDPIHKATIISRGNALGYVEQIPVDDRHNYFKSQMEAKLAVCMGGRTAEEIVFGKSETSSGASSDISRATDIAYKMVTEWGMSDKLGPLNYKKRMGDGYSSMRLSAQTISAIETEVKTLVEKGKSISEEILRRHRKELDNLAFALLDKETLTGEEIKKIVDPNNSRDQSNRYQLLNKDPKNDDTQNDNNNSGKKPVRSDGKTNTSKNEKNEPNSHENEYNDSKEIDTNDKDNSNNMKSDEVNDLNKMENFVENEYIDTKDITTLSSENEIGILSKHFKNENKKLKKKYSRDPNTKNNNVLKMINSHKPSYYSKNENIDSENSINNSLDDFSDNIRNTRDSENNYDNNNTVKNTSELFTNDFSEENNNDNLSSVKTKDINYNNFQEIVDISPIKNVSEMKKFNIYEHNLNKLFLFDIFNN